jgi:hypothetical protein
MNVFDVAKTKIHNHFDFYSVKVDSNDEKHVGHAENVVLDRFYSWLWGAINCSRASGMNCISSIALGTGTTTPSTANSDLTAPCFCADASRTNKGYNSTYGYWEYEYTYELQPTDQVGVHLSEVGLATYHNTTGFTVTKALITDNNGNPIALVKAADEKLIIKATIYIYDPVYSVPANRPAHALMPQWMENWGRYQYYSDTPKADWATPIHCIISGEIFTGWTGNYNSSHHYTFLASGGKFKGLSDVCCELREITSARFGCSSDTYLTTSDTYRSPATYTLNANKFNNNDSRYTMDIYKIGFGVGESSISSSVFHMSCANLPDTVVSGLTLGTADGVKDTWYVPHEDAKNLTCSAGTFNVVTERISEAVPVINNSALAVYYGVGNGVYDNGDNTYSMQSELIRYLNGCAHFCRWDNGAKYLYGVYYYKDATSGEYRSIPVRINIPTLTTDYSCNVEVFALPDNSGLLIYAHANTNGSFMKSYVVSFDYTTGVAGAVLYTSTNRVKFSQDMNYLLYASRDNGYNVVHVQSLVRTSSAITATESFSQQFETTSYLGYLVSCGTSYIKDGLVKLARYVSTNCDNYLLKIDYVAKTITKVLHTGYNPNCVSTNYACALVSNVLTVYSIANEVATAIYTQDLTGTAVSTAPLVVTSLIETQDRIYVIFGLNTNRSNTSQLVIILAKDINNSWYNMNDIHLYEPSMGGYDFYDDIGVIHSEFTIGDYVIALNAMECPGKGNNTYNTGQVGTSYCNSMAIPCIRRQAKIGLKFATPPASGTSIVVGYTLDYLPKDGNWILATTPSGGFSRPS